jgi:hypothetical protein
LIFQITTASSVPRIHDSFLLLGRKYVEGKPEWMVTSMRLVDEGGIPVQAIRMKVCMYVGVSNIEEGEGGAPVEKLNFGP